MKPTIAGLTADGIDYKGFIFIGLMNCAGDPYVIEYNVRMGDPETESVMTRISSDLLLHLEAAASGRLASQKIEISPQAAVTVVMVSGGYPGSYGKGYPVSGLSEAEAAGATVFHMGTKNAGGETVTSGGRVLAVVANAPDIVAAGKKAYAAAAKLSFKDAYNRTDITKDLLKYL